MGAQGGRRTRSGPCTQTRLDATLTGMDRGATVRRCIANARKPLPRRHSRWLSWCAPHSHRIVAALLCTPPAPLPRTRDARVHDVWVWLPFLRVIDPDEGHDGFSVSSLLSICWSDSLCDGDVLHRWRLTGLFWRVVRRLAHRFQVDNPLSSWGLHPGGAPTLEPTLV